MNINILTILFFGLSSIMLITSNRKSVEIYPIYNERTLSYPQVINVKYVKDSIRFKLQNNTRDHM